MIEKHGYSYNFVVLDIIGIKYQVLGAEIIIWWPFSLRIFLFCLVKQFSRLKSGLLSLTLKAEFILHFKMCMIPYYFPALWINENSI
jgi:hypothetical protein